MCVSKGAPPHRKGQKVNDEVREGANVLWQFLHDHNAVFLGDSGLIADLEKFLTEHGLTREKPTAKQDEYLKVIEKGLKSSPEEGANVLWQFLHDHNVVFLGDSGLIADLEKFLTEHGLTRKKSTAKQDEYLKVIEKGLKSSPERESLCAEMHSLNKRGGK